MQPTMIYGVAARGKLLLIATMALATMALAVACGDDDDDGVSEAHQKGVGVACTSRNDCPETAPECLNQFREGYCGVSDCTGDQDCPQGSGCVAHDDGNNYCFLLCHDKPECNYFRPADAESNCTSSVDFVDGSQGSKACVPPSSGD